MNKALRYVLFGLGWILLIIFLVSGSIFSRYNPTQEYRMINPISWKDHFNLFDGLVECALTDAELMERKEWLRTEIFPKTVKKESTESSQTYYFDDDDQLLAQLMEFTQKEKSCCPFFKFDLSILPFNQGIAFGISGSTEAMEFITTAME